MHWVAMLLQENQPSPEQIQRFAMAFMAIIPFLILIGLAIVIIPCWFICKKAGFSPWLSLINIIPFGNVVLLYVLAFAEWKVVPAPQVGYPPPYPPPPQPPLPPRA